MVFDRFGMEVLDETECRRLLASASVGRVGLGGVFPLILPVNYALLDGDVVFRSAPGSKLLAAAEGQVVCFEVDDVDPARRTGWSVVVSGGALVVDDPGEVERARLLPIDPWLAVPQGPFVRVKAQQISGRRIGTNVPTLGDRRP